MMNDFSIKIIKQGWLEGCSAEDDLCSHGLIELHIGGQLISLASEGYGISESALALLRTTKSDHSETNPVAERLIFHGCGSMLMSGCNIGINWEVRHFGGLVELSNVKRYDGNGPGEVVSFPNLFVTLTEEEYVTQIRAFAFKAKSLFDGVQKKVKEQEFYPGEYQNFWDEYNQLMERYIKFRK